MSSSSFQLQLLIQAKLFTNIGRFSRMTVTLLVFQKGWDTCKAVPHCVSLKRVSKLTLMTKTLSKRLVGASELLTFSHAIRVCQQNSGTSPRSANITCLTKFGDRCDWTTGGPHDEMNGGSAASYLEGTLASPSLCFF